MITAVTRISRRRSLSDITGRFQSAKSCWMRYKLPKFSMLALCYYCPHAYDSIPNIPYCSGSGKSGYRTWQPAPQPARRLEAFQTTDHGEADDHGTQDLAVATWLAARQKHIVLTEIMILPPMDVSLPTALQMRCGWQEEVPEAMVIGGAALYQAMLPYASRMYLTLIHAEIAGTPSFPNLIKRIGVS